MARIQGIHIRGEIGRDVAKASANNSIETLGVSSIDGSWVSQVVGFGIASPTSLLSQIDLKLLKVTTVYWEFLRNSFLFGDPFLVLFCKKINGSLIGSLFFDIICVF
jgi:hypothetical protein